MLAHLPQSVMSMQMQKDGYTQVQVLFLHLYESIRTAGVLIFSNSRAANAIETNTLNEGEFKSLLDRLLEE
jgi:hypothetical protein